ncbi:hypothetical protein K474DRAFT_1680890, partial [Panus rudis PR-1116 ss-1]
MALREDSNDEYQASQSQSPPGHAYDELDGRKPSIKTEDDENHWQDLEKRTSSSRRKSDRLRNDTRGRRRTQELVEPGGYLDTQTTETQFFSPFHHIRVATDESESEDSTKDELDVSEVRVSALGLPAQKPENSRGGSDHFMPGFAASNGPAQKLLERAVHIQTRMSEAHTALASLHDEMSALLQECPDILNLFLVRQRSVAESPNFESNSRLKREPSESMTVAEGKLDDSECTTVTDLKAHSIESDFGDLEPSQARPYQDFDMQGGGYNLPETYGDLQTQGDLYCSRELRFIYRPVEGTVTQRKERKPEVSVVPSEPEGEESAQGFGEGSSSSRGG